MISIESMRGGNWPSRPYQVRVDRAGVFGNPFGMRKLHERAASCDKYHEYFHEKVVNDPEFLTAVNELAKLYKQYGKLTLMCWCAPLRCHSETIKAYLEDVLCLN